MADRVLLRFIVGQRVVSEGEDICFEGEVVSCFVKRDMETVRYVVETDEGCCILRREAIAVGDA